MCGRPGRPNQQSAHTHMSGLGISEVEINTYVVVPQRISHPYALVWCVGVLDAQISRVLTRT